MTVYEKLAGSPIDMRILYTFDPAKKDGTCPNGLLRDSAGNLYGTTRDGGSNGAGTVFKIDAMTGTESILHSFGSATIDGQHPNPGLMMDSAGYLYGTTSDGGEYGYGTVFKIKK